MIALADLTVPFAVLVVVALVACVLGTVRDRQGDTTSIRITERRGRLDEEAARAGLPPFLQRGHVDARHGWCDFDHPSGKAH